MSQPLPPKPGERDDPGPPLKGKDELLEWFFAQCKPREQFRIGTEHEKFGFLRESKQPLPFDGPQGIEAILNAIADDEEDRAANGEWTRITDSGHVVALARSGASITLEPGGQLELSGAPLKSIFETCDEVGAHLALLKKICRPMGVGFLGMGFHPTASWDDMPVVPKSRYGIMRRHMPKVGTRGLDMMKRTCTVQANFDFDSEADMVDMFRTSLALTPLVTALFAYSPFRDGKFNGALSERTLVWGDTDPERCGFPPVVFEEGFGFEKWLDYILDVPMYFIRRDGVHHDYSGASFRTFLEEGMDGHRATMRDFMDQLTVAFPEVRVKGYLEVRGADSGPWSRICALPALWKGLLYDPQARAAAWELMENASPKELFELQQDVGQRGFRAEYRGESILPMCERLVSLSTEGLERLKPEGARSETLFLKPLVQAVSEKRTWSQWLIERYENEWNGDINRLWNELEFDADD